MRSWNESNAREIDGLVPFESAEVIAELRRSRPGPFSKPAFFQMGKPAPEDWNAQWIAADSDISSPLFRKEFSVEKTIARATATICGLGYYELYLNGEKVGDHVLDPGTTFYHNDTAKELDSRVLYVTYDVTDRLKQGPNAVGAILGHGWYSAEDDVPPSPSHREPYSDRPRLILQLDIEYADGSVHHVGTDATFKTSAGPITYNDYSHGETYDARLEKPGWTSPEYDDSGWAAAELAESPSGTLRAQMLPPIRVVETIQPVRLMNPKPGVFVYDMGKNFSGWCRLRARGPAGTKVVLRHAAKTRDGGHLDNRSNTHPRHIARQTDTYLLKGDGEEIWEPRFTLHGFRYVEVTGFPGEPKLENLEGRFVRSSVASAGTFYCNNDLINRIHDNIRRTFACCFQSMPQDAMDRSERVAWLGDPGMIAEDAIYNFDTAAFWSKWLNDIRDNQLPSGQVPYVSPIHWRGDHSPYSAMPVWQSSYPLFVWYVHQYYDDARILAEHYEGMKKLIGYFGTLAEGHVITAGLGDHMEPQADGTSSGAPRHTPAALTSTAYYYFDTLILARAAKVLGKDEDARRYFELAANIKEAFNREFLDPQTSDYATGSQTSNAVALHLGLVPEQQIDAVVKNLVDDIVNEHNGHLSTGIVGINALEQSLPLYGRADVMYGIATKTTFPSWGHQVSLGATTLWEPWDYNPDRQMSLNMKMLGSSEKFFFHDLAGIGAASPGFREITIKPQPVGDLREVRASFNSVRGLIRTEWHRDERSFVLDTSIPVNSTAQVHLPKLGWSKVSVSGGAEDVWRDGKLVDRLQGIKSGAEDDSFVSLELGSGNYHFVLRNED